MNQRVEFFRGDALEKTYSTEGTKVNTFKAAEATSMHIEQWNIFLPAVSSI